MESIERVNLQNRTAMMMDPRFIAAVFGTIFTIPALLYLLVAGDLRLIRQTREWRTAVRTNAEILSHEYVATRMALSREDASNYRPSFHKISFRFRAGDVEVADEIELPSGDAESITIDDRRFPLKQGGTIPAYYLPDSPNKYVLFEDAKAIFWTSVKRLLWLVMIALTCVVIVLLVVIFYRPRKSERYLPDKLSAPQANIDLNDIKINT